MIRQYPDTRAFAPKSPGSQKAAEVGRVRLLVFPLDQFAQQSGSLVQFRRQSARVGIAGAAHIQFGGEVIVFRALPPG